MLRVEQGTDWEQGIKSFIVFFLGHTQWYLGLTVGSVLEDHF